MLIKRKNIGSINKIVDLYNLISIDSKIALGAHDMDQTEGNVTLRFTDGSENYQPLQSDQNVKIALNEPISMIPIRFYVAWKFVR